jgi:ADP-heptose:LPS heptosyltransferase
MGNGQHSLYTHPVAFQENVHIRDTFKTIAHSLFPPYYCPNGRLRRRGEQKGVYSESTNQQKESPTDELIPILLTQEDQLFLDSFSKEHGISAQDFLVGINVNASEVAKERRWLPERFAELADRITLHGVTKIVLLGSRNERKYVEGVAAQMTAVPIMAAGKTTLRQMIALLSRCNLFISNDSGPVHMASAQGTPTVAIFGPESPVRYGPRGEQHRAIYKGLPCSPCISFHNAKKVHCPEPKPPCIYQITVDEIWEAVKPLLPSSSPP